MSASNINTCHYEALPWAWARSAPPPLCPPPGLFTTAKQLQRLHVLNFSVLIKLLKSCHITLGHQED